MHLGKNSINKKQFILHTSIFILLISVGLIANTILNYETTFELTSINIKEMSTASVAKKIGAASNKKIIEVTNEIEEEQTVEVRNISNEVNDRVWYLPVEMGQVTTYPNYYHTAFDITSPRGYGETIYPVAAGTISSIYQDYAGALIVTIRHNIDGRMYTSQYVHLSRYADIYEGQEVTPYTPIGWMGTSGISTGVHLHVALIDCNLYGDNVCGDLNGFFNYSRGRFNEGFTGLGNVIDVPYQWWSR